MICVSGAPTLDVPMNIVEQAARSLPSSLIAQVQAEASLEVEVARLRVAGFRRKEAELESRLTKLTSTGHQLLRTFADLLRQDIALFAFVEAMHDAGIAGLADVSREADRIIANANIHAGFDVLPWLRDASKGTSERSQPDDLEIEELRELLSEHITAKLARAPLSAFLSFAKLINQPQLQYEIQSNFERLQAAARRTNAGWTAQMREAGRLYLEGKVEVAELGRILSLEPFDIAFELERLGYSRRPEELVLRDGDREEMLLQLEKWRIEKRKSSTVQRDVIASQRIEGIDARPHLRTRPSE